MQNLKISMCDQKRFRTKGGEWIEQRLGQANTRIMAKSTRRKLGETKKRLETRSPGLGFRTKTPNRGRELITAEQL